MTTKRAHNKDTSKTTHGSSEPPGDPSRVGAARTKAMPTNGHPLPKNQAAEPSTGNSRKASQESKSERAAKKNPTKKSPPRNKGLRFPEMHVALGEVLRMYRRQLNVSQSDIGMDADVDRAYLSRVERAEQSPTVATLLAIAEKLGVPASRLLLEAEERVMSKGRGSKQ